MCFVRIISNCRMPFATEYRYVRDYDSSFIDVIFPYGAKGLTSESLRLPQVVVLQSIFFACPCRPCQCVLSRSLRFCACIRLVRPCPVIMPAGTQYLSILYKLASLHHLPASWLPIVLVCVNARESTRVFHGQKFWEMRDRKCIRSYFDVLSCLRFVPPPSLSPPHSHRL